MIRDIKGVFYELDLTEPVCLTSNIVILASPEYERMIKQFAYSDIARSLAGTKTAVELRNWTLMCRYTNEIWMPSC